MTHTLPKATTEAVGVECDCVASVNGLLKEHNSILMTNLFGRPRAIIATVKADEKIRGKPKLMFASFCPFCGIQYAARSKANGGE